MKAMLHAGPSSTAAPGRRAMLALALVALLAAPGAAPQDDSLDPIQTAGPLEPTMAKLAQNIKKLLAEEHQKTIAVGRFGGPAKYTTTGGPAISKALIDQLTAIGVIPDKKAKFEVKGDYLAVEDETNSGKVLVSLLWRVLDPRGKTLLQGRFGIDNEDAVFAILGPSVSIPAGSTAKERNEKLIAGIVEPKVHIEPAEGVKPDAPQSIVRADSDSPYAIEILVGSKPKTVTSQNGRAYVALEMRDTYAVRLINDSATEAAVTLNIDGLNAFTFSEVKNSDGRRRYNHWIVPPKSNLTIQGWHRTNEAAEQFEVGEYVQSGAAQSLEPDLDVGTITATFAAAWAHGNKPPDDEPAVTRNGGASAATIRGSTVEQVLREVTFHVGELRSSISIRYLKGPST